MLFLFCYALVKWNHSCFRVICRPLLGLLWKRIIIERKSQDVFSCWNNEHEPDVSDEDINLVNPPVPTEFGGCQVGYIWRAPIQNEINPCCGNFRKCTFSSFSVCTAASVTFIAFCRRTQISGIIFTGMYRVLTRKADTQTSVGWKWILSWQQKRKSSGLVFIVFWIGALYTGA